MAMTSPTFNQLATVLNSIVGQATGGTALTATDYSSFISVAQYGLQTGYDPLATAVSQVLGKTIFSIRPYSRKFKGLKVDTQRFGNHIRKLNIADKDFVEDDRIKLTDGSAIDHYTVRKPSIVQTNFYGTNVYSDYVTIYKDQLDCAFTTPEEFSRFITMVTQNISDKLEQARENTARALVTNVIGARLAVNNSPSVIHLLTEYNAATGLSLTATTVMQPANFANFIRWMFARIQTISDMMTERSQLWHTNITNKAISRHTPKDRQRMYLLAPIFNQVDAAVLSTTFNDEYLKIADYEPVNFWQSIQTPDSINITAAYMDTDGTIATGAVSNTTVIGVLMDEEAAIYSSVNQWMSATPLNAAGGYTNFWWHESHRYLQDDTENSVVFCLD